MSIWHVIPEADEKPHVVDSKCSCNPSAKPIDGTGDMLVIHNSFDGREVMELVQGFIDSDLK